MAIPSWLDVLKSCDPITIPDLRDTFRRVGYRGMDAATTDSIVAYFELIAQARRLRGSDGIDRVAYIGGR